MRPLLPPAPAGAPAPGLLRSLFMRSGGRRRRMALYLPADHDGVPLPLVLDLHGSTSHPEEQLAVSGMASAAERHRFAVLAPEAVDRAWNVPVDAAGPDDVRFVADALDFVASLAAVDTARVCATGFSGGGRMACLLAGALDGRIAAIAPVGGLRFDPDHAPGRPVPVLAFHGLLDPINPFDGGGPAYWRTGVVDALEAWAAHDGCEGREVDHPSPGVTRAIHGAGNRSVILYAVDGLGHQWPGSPIDIGDPFGPPAPRPPATDLIAAFFAERLARSTRPPQERGAGVVV